MDFHGLRKKLRIQRDNMDISAESTKSITNANNKHKEATDSCKADQIGLQTERTVEK